jgi:hypothetical protein
MFGETSDEDYDLCSCRCSDYRSVGLLTVTDLQNRRGCCRGGCCGVLGGALLAGPVGAVAGGAAGAATGAALVAPGEERLR